MIVLKDSELNKIYEQTKSFTLYDPARNVRIGSTSFRGSESVQRRFLNLSNQVEYFPGERSREIKRHATKILKEYFEYRRAKRQKILIPDEVNFIESLIYYTRIINGIPAKKPPTLDPGLREFINERYGRLYRKNLISIKNNTYYAMRRALGDVADEIDDKILRLSTIFDKWFPQSFSIRKRNISVGAFVLHTIEVGDYKADIDRICSVLGITRYYLISFYRRRKKSIERVYNAMDEDDKKEFIKTFDEILNSVWSAKNRSKNL